MISVRRIISAAIVLLVSQVNLSVAQDETQLEPPIIQLDTGTFAASEINCLAINHDDSQLAVGGGKEVRIWDIRTGRLVHTLRGYMEPDGFNIGKVNTIAFSKDDRFLVVGVTDNSELGSTRIYDLRRSDGALTLVPGHTGCTIGSRLSDDGTEILTYGCSGELEVIEIDARKNETKVKQRIPLAFKSPESMSRLLKNPLPSFFGAYPSDRWVVIRDYGSLIIVDRQAAKTITDETQWPKELRRLFEWENQHVPLQVLKTNRFSSKPALTRRGNYALYARGGISQSDSTSQFWVAVYRVGDTAPHSVYTSHRFDPANIVFSPSGNLAVSSDLLGEVHVWGVDDSSMKLKLKTTNRPLFGLKWIDNQQLLLSTNSFTQRDYKYNNYGALDSSFNFADRSSLKKLTSPRFAQRPSESMVETTFGRVRIKEVFDAGKFQLEFTPSRSGITIEPINYAPVTVHGTYNGDLIVGTENGSLGQFRLSKSEFVNRPKSFYFKPVRSFRGHRGMVSGLDVSSQGILASCSVDGTIRFWSLEEPKPNGDIAASMEGNRVVAIYPPRPEDSPQRAAELAGDPIALAGGDTILKFNNKPFYERRLEMARGRYEPNQKVPLVFQRDGQTFETTITLVESSRDAEPLASMYVHEDQNWIIWTPEGYYDCSPDGEKYVGWHLNRGRQFPAQYFGVGQFRKQLYAPELVTKAISHNNASASVSILEKSPAAPVSSIPAVHTTGGIEASRPPIVKIVSPRDEALVNGETVEVLVEVEAKEDLREQNVLVLVNGRRLSGEQKLSEQGTEKGLVKARYQYTCQLDQPINFIRASASHQRAESNIDRIQVQRADSVPKNSDAGRLFVLAIGVANYQSPEWRLKAAANDATAFCEKMKEMEGGMFAQVNTTLLTDEQATPNNIRNAMGEMVVTANGINDVVYFFLSGHAIKSNDTFRFLCADYDEKTYRTTSIGVGEINDWFQNELKAKAIMFADTCHAAGVSKIRSRGATASPWQGTSRLILSACGANGQSYESDDHGFFTQAILDACNNRQLADKIPSDGRLTVSELKAYLEFEVEKLSKGLQSPLLYDPGEASRVVFFEFGK